MGWIQIEPVQVTHSTLNLTETRPVAASSSRVLMGLQYEISQTKSHD